MSPNSTQVEYVLNENEYEKIFRSNLSKEETEIELPEERKYKYRWGFIVYLSLFHIQAVYGIYLSFTSAKLLTTIFGTALHLVSLFAITAGAHRLWSHRAYKATWQLKLILVICQTLSFQGSVYRWCRDHRIHHKYTDTDADPHNSRRGVFYSHIGWILVERHPQYVEKIKLIDFSDLKNDPLLKFQIRYYFQLLFVFCFLLPIIIPWYFWNETLKNAWFICVCSRYIFSLQTAMLVNSWAHIWGTQPYDRRSSGRESLIASIMTVGEAWHNFHHTFPWDYRASELSGFLVNPTMVLLQLFAKIGWAYELKTVSDDLIRKRIKRTGDGSHPTAIWGWGDHEQSDDNKSFAKIEN
ncbi:acyl-CoA Delta-9 desaturase-like isoform X1 [Chrysoperla carnea]|uniref:acyl-CoA Delta-9 desaturase-like isoform X1 n=1 Tax=Chrysoperla carnea TaxID=189513 RepID=UPI001D0818AB|nr:acyl-CoA Delta-9 desaturase-like isoform X1 [Chrysoperla carnea]